MKWLLIHGKVDISLEQELNLMAYLLIRDGCKMVLSASLFNST